MEILTNQTLYKCSYCGHRMLTKSGAKLHEERYCKNENSPRVKNCKHENIETVWSQIRGEEHREEPDYDVCTECGTQF